MIARRSFQTEKVAFEDFNCEIATPPSRSQEKIKSPTSAMSPSQTAEHFGLTSLPKGTVSCRGEPIFEDATSPDSSKKSAGENKNEQHIKWKGEDPKDAQERQQRKDSAQEIIAKEEEVGKRNMMERLKDIVEQKGDSENKQHHETLAISFLSATRFKRHVPNGWEEELLAMFVEENKSPVQG
ncbi:hypothetical protein FKW77_005417 [Venturia effusa]|uniref:Uncharacterized protein n=1 Tax=Venturia effusa TaxID=50376 RepID=A0A517LRD8_9PEZI|nr:hypothetical protein FKW77_005417 [Venturia effusa]